VLPTKTLVKNATLIIYACMLIRNAFKEHSRDLKAHISKVDYAQCGDGCCLQKMSKEFSSLPEPTFPPSPCAPSWSGIMKNTHRFDII